MTETIQKESHAFQAEVGKVLDLVIHSLYSNKEIFLRELISNASDANDKLRFMALSNSRLLGDDLTQNIKVSFDTKARTITVSDNGIGMSREEAIEHLGTIAKSGTKEFLSQLSGDQSKDSHLIGQFGVGFYSAFIVADKVTVRSRRADLPAEAGVEWQSDGVSNYTVNSIEKRRRGTDVILHLRDNAEEFLNEYRLTGIIKKYSDHISWPIVMDKTTEEKEGEKTIIEETLNRATAIWRLPKTQITDEQYNEFYKHISGDPKEPLFRLHTHVEGTQNYVVLLYIPSHAPFDLWQPDFRYGLKLYVQRVFIMDDAEKFMPRYLRFVKGIVDSSDLPLNVSREILQDNKLIDTIRAASVKKILAALEKMASDEPEKYQNFWNEFGQVLKEGPIEDFSNRETIAKLLRFATTQNDSSQQTVSLSDYIARMKPEQNKIYYMTAENFNAAKNSPHLEYFRKKEIEVLLLSDRIDEWLVAHLTEFDGKTLQSVAKGALDLPELDNETEKEAHKKTEDEFASFIDHVKTVLSEKVKDVRITHRLTNSPACLVSDENDLGRQMQRMLQSVGQQIPMSRPIFELNPEHPLVVRLKNEPDDQRFAAWIQILFDQAILAEGEKLEDSAQFVERLNKMLVELL